MAVFFWLNVEIVEYGVYQPKDKVVAVIDYSDQEPEEVLQEEYFDENGNTSASNLTNVAANANQEKTSYTNESFSKSQTDQDVWNELKALEANEYNSINKQKVSTNSEIEDIHNEQKEINQNLVKEGQLFKYFFY